MIGNQEQKTTTRGMILTNFPAGQDEQKHYLNRGPGKQSGAALHSGIQSSPPRVCSPEKVTPLAARLRLSKRHKATPQKPWLAVKTAFFIIVGVLRMTVASGQESDKVKTPACGASQAIAPQAVSFALYLYYRRSRSKNDSPENKKRRRLSTQAVSLRELASIASRRMILAHGTLKILLCRAKGGPCLSNFALCL